MRVLQSALWYVMNDEWRDVSAGLERLKGDCTADLVRGYGGHSLPILERRNYTPFLSVYHLQGKPLSGVQHSEYATYQRVLKMGEKESAERMRQRWFSSKDHPLAWRFSYDSIYPSSHLIVVEYQNQIAATEIYQIFC